MRQSPADRKRLFRSREDSATEPRIPFRERALDKPPPAVRVEGAVPRGPGRWALPSVTHTFNSDTVVLSLHALPQHQFTLFAKLSWDPRGSAIQVQQVTIIPPAPWHHTAQFPEFCRLVFGGEGAIVVSRGITCPEGEVARLAPRTGRSRTLVLVRAALCGCACCALHNTEGFLSRDPRERPSAGAVALVSPGPVCSSQLTGILPLGGA